MGVRDRDNSSLVLLRERVTQARSDTRGRGRAYLSGTRGASGDDWSC